MLNDNKTRQVADEIEKVARSKIAPYSLGKWLAEKARELQHPDETLDTLLRRHVRVKGRSERTLKAYMRLYRIYRDFPPAQMDQLNDQMALALALNIVLRKRVDPGTIITDDDCQLPRHRALEMALGTLSFESLAIQLRQRSDYVPPFSNERDIEKWFEKYRHQLASDHGMTHIASAAASGPALGNVDHVFARATNDNEIALILVELKDAVFFNDIGQVLGQRNELIERSKATPEPRYRMAELYPKWNNDYAKFGERSAKPEKFSKVESWILGQVFSDSAYFAAIGQDIAFFRIKANDHVEGPCNAKTMQRQDWERFTQQRQ